MTGRVRYSRAYIESRSLPVIFVGNSTWLEDIAKHLSRSWKQIQWAPTEESLKEILALGLPKICLIELGAMNHSELRLIETMLPKTIRTVIIGPDGSEGSLWQRIERRLCPYGIPALILPRQATAAAEELSEVLEDCVSLGIYNNEEEFALIRAGNRGFLSASRDRSSKILHPDFFNAAFSLLLAQFTFTVNEAESAMILAEAYDYWKAPKPPHDEIHYAFLQVENRLIRTQAIQILELAVDLTTRFYEDRCLSEIDWEMLLERNGLQKGSRKFASLYGQINSLFDEYSKRYQRTA